MFPVGAASSLRFLVCVFVGVFLFAISIFFIVTILDKAIIMYPYYIIQPVSRGVSKILLLLLNFCIKCIKLLSVMRVWKLTYEVEIVIDKDKISLPLL